MTEESRDIEEMGDNAEMREGQSLDDALDERAARAPRKDRNVDIIERTLSLAARAQSLSGEVTYNSATEAGAREKIDAFKAHMGQGLAMGKELLALFKA